MPSTIGKCELFRIKHTTLLEGKTFLRNKHKIAFFFKIKCTFIGRKENSFRLLKNISACYGLAVLVRRNIRICIKITFHCEQIFNLHCNEHLSLPLIIFAMYHVKSLELSVVVLILNYITAK